ncbi:MAG: hypothetical protein GXO23_04195, partial [Crenarchaeota archaeon]|nr:hypothetical protein [Thermoproteota archaeon]
MAQVVSIDLFTLEQRFDVKRVEDLVRKFWSEHQIPKKWREITWTRPLFTF